MEETLRVIFPKDMPGINFVEVRGRSRLSRMFNDRYNLLVATKGSSEWSYRGIVHERAPGDVALFEPGEVRVDLKIHSPLDYRVVCIEKPSLDGLLLDSGIRLPRGDFHFRSAVAKDIHLAAALQNLFYGIDAGSSLLERKSMLYGLGAILLTTAFEQPASSLKPQSSSSIRRAYEMLIEQYSENISLDSLASAAQLSPYHFVGAFRKRYGLPPHAFQLAVRIAMARSMVADGLSGTEIAHSLGFSDHAHLIRQFKRWQGVPPGSFTRKIVRP
jgi:AraC-like DNA-binding protein